MRRYPLIAFFVLAYVFTWLTAIPMFVAAENHVDPSAFTLGVFLLVGSAGPTFAALLMARVADGPAGINDLVTRLLRWRVPLLWWSIALFFFPVTMLAAAAGYLVAGGTIDWSVPATPYELPFWVLFAGLPVFALLEEIGWRGYALPRLQRRHSPLVASIILGVLWACWHLPTFFIEGSPQYGAPFLGYLVATTMFAIVVTWFYNHTQSVLLTTVLHASYNYSFLTVPVGRQPVVLATFGTIGLLLTIVVIVQGRMAKRLHAPPAVAPQLA